jgi:uncharacterized protein YabN with tetrapyrrole methylase and pyrophosphatase domain
VVPAARPSDLPSELHHRHIERRLTERGQDIHTASLDEMNALWDEAKAQGL